MDIMLPALSPPDRLLTARQATPHGEVARTAGMSAQSARQDRQAREGRDQVTQTREAKADQSIQQARIRFEYEQAHRVVKVHDSRGVLIYQIPPQGALQLILEEERSARLQETA